MYSIYYLTNSNTLGPAYVQISEVCFTEIEHFVHTCMFVRIKNTPTIKARTAHDCGKLAAFAGFYRTGK